MAVLGSNPSRRWRSGHGDLPRVSWKDRLRKRLVSSSRDASLPRDGVSVSTLEDFFAGVSWDEDLDEDGRKPMGSSRPSPSL